LLVRQFEAAGGHLVLREFHDPAQFASLPEKVVINCTGYGARALWRDESVMPVRGQIAYLAPQRAFDYALAYRDVNVVPRSDGIVVQSVVGGDMHGYGDESLAVDRREADAAVQMLAELYRWFRPRMRS
jgi:glycine/D-amino acid oxidase-like deaminating enzyme